MDISRIIPEQIEAKLGLQKVIMLYGTWRTGKTGILILEIVLGMSFFMRRNNLNWKILFLVGVFFHLGILVIFGLVTFFMIMTSALVLYLMPFEYQIPNPWRRQ